MNVLVLSAKQGVVGGIQKVSLELSEGLVREYGLRIHLVYSSEGPLLKLWDRFVTTSTRIKHLRIRRRHPVSSLLAVVNLANLVNSLNINIIHLHSNADIPIVYWALKFINKKPKVILHLHTERRGGRPSRPQYYSIIDGYIAVSRSTAVSWSELSMISYENVSVVYNGASASSDFITDKHNESKRIIYVGRFSVDKGTHVLCDAIEALNREESAVSVVALGKFPDKMSDVDANSLRKRMLSQEITILGPRSDPYDEIAKSDILVLPSLSEGFPRVIIEAMQLGIPVVATDVGGISEMMLDELQDYLLKPRSSSDLVEKIVKVLDCPPSPHRMKEIGEKFSLNGMISGVFDIYNSLIAQ